MNGRIRRFTVTLTTLALLLSGFPARAENEIRVVLGGQQLAFDVPPALVNGRVLVPLRKIFEAFGAKITYDPAARQITAVRGPIRVELTVDDPSVLVDGGTSELDVPPQVVEGRTLVPLRFVSEALGGTVAWDPVSRTVTIEAPTTSAGSDPNLGAADLPGGNWAVSVGYDFYWDDLWKVPSSTERKVYANSDPSAPLAWVSISSVHMSADVDAFVRETPCRSQSISATWRFLGKRTAKACQNTGPDGEPVITLKVAAGEYLVTVAAGPRGSDWLLALDTLESMAQHQIAILGAQARGKPRPEPLKPVAAREAQPAEQQPEQTTPPPPKDEPPKTAEQPPEQETEKPPLITVQLRPPPAPLTFTAPSKLYTTLGKGREHRIFSFCQPEPKHLTSPCGPMPPTTNPTGGNPPYHFTLGTMGGFPPIGVSLLKDGHLVGEPAAATAGRTYPFTVCAADLSGHQVCREVELSVAEPLGLPALAYLPQARVNKPYRYSFCDPEPASLETPCGGSGQAAVSPQGGLPPYTFRIDGAAPPAGLTLAPNGVLHGSVKPGADPSVWHWFRVCVKDSAGSEACGARAMSVNVNEEIDRFESTAWTGSYSAGVWLPLFRQVQGTFSFRLGKWDAEKGHIPVAEAAVPSIGEAYKFTDGYLSCADYKTACTYLRIVFEDKRYGYVLVFDSETDEEIGFARIAGETASWTPNHGVQRGTFTAARQ